MEIQSTNVSKITGKVYYSRQSFGTAEVRNSSYMDICNDEGQSWEIATQVFERECLVHNQFTEEIKIARQNLIKILVEEENVKKIFTVHYLTKVQEDEAVAKISDLYPNQGGMLLSKDEYDEIAAENVRDILSGTPRTLIGYHYNSFDPDGRLRVIDLEKSKEFTENGWDKRNRLVDVRTIKWLIIDNIKFVVK